MSQDPKIGYENLFTKGTVSVTSENASFPKENGYDWFTDDFWQPTAGGTQRISVDMGVDTAVDYVAVVAHDLYTQGASIRLQNSPDGVSWFNVGDEITPSDNTALMRVFAEATARYWAVRITSPTGNIVSIGTVSVGKSMTIPIGFFVGYQPPRLNERHVRLVSNSENGEFIGQTVIRKGLNDALRLEYLTPAWVRSTWKDFAAHAVRTPFFFAWYPSKYPDEVVYITDVDDPEASNQHQKFMSVNMSMRGRT